jgi:hypothetical protein
MTAKLVITLGNGVRHTLRLGSEIRRSAIVELALSNGQL